MIIKSTKLYEGLRPVLVSKEKLTDIKNNPEESDHDAIERFIRDKYHLQNPRDWMFAPEDELIVVFFPKLTDSKVSRIADDLGGMYDSVK